MAEYYQLTEAALDDFGPLFTEDALTEFKTDPEILAVGAGDEGVACAVMLIKVTEYILHITYIYVSEAKRRKGIATGLLNLAQDMAFNEEKPLLAYFSAGSEDEAIYRLFRTSDAFAVSETGDRIYRSPIDALANAKKWLSEKDVKYVVTRFLELPEQERESFLQKCSRKNEAYIDPYEKDFLPALCLAAKDADEIKAAVFIAQTGDEISVRYVYSENPMALRKLFGEVATAASKLSDKIKTIKIATVNDESEKMLKKVFPGAEQVGAFYVASMDLSV